MTRRARPDPAVVTGRVTSAVITPRRGSVARVDERTVDAPPAARPKRPTPHPPAYRADPLGDGATRQIVVSCTPEDVAAADAAAASVQLSRSAYTRRAWQHFAAFLAEPHRWRPAPPEDAPAHASAFVLADALERAHHAAIALCSDLQATPRARDAAVALAAVESALAALKRCS